MAKDAAGNTTLSSPVHTFTVDTSAPSGTITIEGGASYTGTQAPAITLTKDADVSQYQLCADNASTGSDCPTVLRAWSAYNASPPAHDFGADGA